MSKPGRLRSLSIHGRLLPVFQNELDVSFPRVGVYIQMTETVRDAYVAHDGYVSDKWSSFLTVYEELFSALKTKPIRLLEIGVQNGGSLQIWRRCFPNAVAIVGCDFAPRVAKLRPGPRIHLVVGDIASASTVESIKRVCPEYDIVIDDGSHRSEHIIAAFQQLFPLVAPGGLFIAAGSGSAGSGCLNSSPRILSGSCRVSLIAGVSRFGRGGGRA